MKIVGRRAADQGRFRAAGLVGLLLCSAPASAGWGPIGSVPGFRGWRAELRHLVERDGRPGRHRFCLVVRTWPADASGAGGRWAYVHWREAGRLYTFAPSDGPMSDLGMFKAPLDLSTDVVATEREIAGSTYRVTREWLDGVLRRCARHGTSVVLTRRRGAPARRPTR